MVNTRSTLRKQALLKDQEEEQNQQTVKTAVRKGEQKEQAPVEEPVRVARKLFHDDVEPGTSGQCIGSHVVSPSKLSTRKSKSRKSSSASILARKKQLELAAAEAKARIELQLIDKKLQADIAALDDEYSSHSEEHEVRSTNSEVEKWLERSHHEQLAQPVQLDGPLSGELCPPAATVGGTEGTVHMLASALKDLAAVSKGHAPNNKLLSRISTQKDLPVFAGDPLEWLYFKQAYNESTQVCNFTPSENLWRLRSCLRGPAKEAVTALLISATTPDTVMSALELQFGNPDLIISRIVQDIQKLPTMAQEYHRDIVKFSVKVQNFVAAVTSIGEDEYLKNMNIMAAVLSKFPTVLLAKWTDYSYPLITEGSKAKLIILSEFLRDEAVKTTRTAVNINYTKPERNQYNRTYTENYTEKSHRVLIQSESEDLKCRFCRSGLKHKLPDCKVFKKALRKDRWRYVKRYRICFKCLLDTKHDRQICPASSCDVNNCGLPHHRLLHYEFTGKNSEKPSEKSTDALEPAENHTESHQITHIRDNKRPVLLKVISVQVHGPRGTETTSALLDDGATVSLISSDLAEKLDLRGNKETMRVCGAWNSHTLDCDSEIVKLTVSNRDGQLFTFKANSVHDLNLPAQDTSNICIQKYKHMSEIENQISLQKYKPQILIGQDNYHMLLPLQVLEGLPGEPYATLTPLGWCLHGCTGMQASSSPLHSTLLLSSNHCDLDTKSEYLRQKMHDVRGSSTVCTLGATVAPREDANYLRVQSKTHLEKNNKLTERKMKTNYDYLFLQREYSARIIISPRTWYLPYLSRFEYIQFSKQLLTKDIKLIQDQGQDFKIRNSTYDSIPNETLEPKAVRFNLVPGNRIPTRRDMQRVMMYSFDEFGFLSPITIRRKITLQETWRELYAQWTEGRISLEDIDLVWPSRHYQAATSASERKENAPSVLNSSGSDAHAKLELSVFCDALINAIHAGVYRRWKCKHRQAVWVAFYGMSSQDDFSITTLENRIMKLTREADEATTERDDQLLTRFSQAQLFHEDLEHLKKQKTLSTYKRKLLTLTLFLDARGKLPMRSCIDVAPGTIKRMKKLPGSPHWGGPWKRLVRSVETSLKVVQKEQERREELLVTLMSEVEQKVKGRPLTHIIFVEPSTTEAIALNKFVLGTSSNLSLTGAFDDSNLFLRRQRPRLSSMSTAQYWRGWILRHTYLAHRSSLSTTICLEVYGLEAYVKCCCRARTSPGREDEVGAAKKTGGTRRSPTIWRRVLSPALGRAMLATRLSKILFCVAIFYYYNKYGKNGT